VRRSAVLVLVLLTCPVSAEAQTTWNPVMAGNVYAAAFAFMAPRTLTAIPMAKLTLWGLRGLTALDPAVGPTMSADGIALIDRNQVALSAPLPLAEDAARWGAVAAQLCSRATQVSPAIAEAGTTGVVTSFFDELFNHFDPYSRYIPPGTRADNEQPASVGFTLVVRRHGTMIATIEPNGPAAAAGLAVADQILAIDGQSTRGETADDLGMALDGAAGTVMTLEVLSHHRRAQTISVIRTAIVPETVFAARQGPMLVIQISAFQQTTAAHFRQTVMDELGKPPAPRGLVVDLRGNRGGLLDQAVSVADSLIDRGTIASTMGRNPAADQLWRASNGDLAGGLPLVVLVDGRTASAAEVLAAALADNNRGVVVGSATLGKGLVQSATSLPDGGDLLVTWARLLAPLGWPLQGLGVMPQICTSGSTDSVEAALQSLADGQQPMGDAIRQSRSARPGIALNKVLEIRDACPAALGSSLDMQAAQFLLTTPPAYSAALVGTP
jgi:carboxyl-terminal processing protease